MSKKIVINFLFISIGFILFFTYFYLPSQNEGVIKIKENTIIEKTKEIAKSENKNIFTNTEYVTENKDGQIFTTKAKESYFFLEKPDFIYLNDIYSFSNLKKDNSIITIQSKRGTYDKLKKNTIYQKQVIIKNKNYLITSDKAEHSSSKNMIIISGNVILKDLTLGLSHIAYCDIIEINTITNDVVAFMMTKNKKIIAEKYK